MIELVWSGANSTLTVMVSPDESVQLQSPQRPRLTFWLLHQPFDEQAIIKCDGNVNVLSRGVLCRRRAVEFVQAVVAVLDSLAGELSLPVGMPGRLRCRSAWCSAAQRRS